MNAIYLLLLTEFILFCFSYRMTKGDIISPSVVSLFLFLISTLGIIYNIDYWNVKFSFKAYITVSLGLFVMVLTEWVVISYNLAFKNFSYSFKPLDKSRNLVFIPYRLNIQIVFFTGLLTLYYIYEVFKTGSQLGAMGLSVIGMNKYNENGMSIISKLGYRIISLLFLVYAYIVINNVIGCGRKIRKELINLLPILFGLCIIFFSGSRTMLVELPVGCVLMMIVIIRDRKGRKNVKLKNILKIAFPVGISILATFYSMRIISKTSTTIGDRSIVDYLTYYISSPLYLFSNYLENPSYVYGKSQYFGELSFMGLYNTLYKLGITDHEVGYNAFLLVGGTSNLAGNEFSWFQRPYHDFGLFGMLIFTVLVYGIFSYVYYNQILTKGFGRRRDLNLIFYSYFYYIIVLSFYYPYTTSEFIPQNIMYLMIIAVMYKVSKFSPTTR